MRGERWGGSARARRRESAENQRTTHAAAAARGDGGGAASRTERRAGEGRTAPRETSSGASSSDESDMARARAGRMARHGVTARPEHCDERCVRCVVQTEALLLSCQKFDERRFTIHKKSARRLCPPGGASRFRRVRARAQRPRVVRARAYTLAKAHKRPSSLCAEREALEQRRLRRRRRRRRLVFLLARRPRRARGPRGGGRGRRGRFRLPVRPRLRDSTPPRRARRSNGSEWTRASNAASGKTGAPRPGAAALARRRRLRPRPRRRPRPRCRFPSDPRPS